MITEDLVRCADQEAVHTFGPGGFSMVRQQSIPLYGDARLGHGGFPGGTIRGRGVLTKRSVVVKF